MSSRANVQVLLLSWNNAAHAREAVRSIAQQRDVEVDLVAVDNGSKDGSADVIASAAKEFNVELRQIRNEVNLGIGAGLNAGLAVSRAEFVAPFAADDIMTPGRLARQAELLGAATETYSAVIGDVELINDEGNDILDASGRPKKMRAAWLLDEERQLQGLIDGRTAPAPSAFLRRSAIDAAGGYRTDLAIEDLPMWLSFCLKQNRLMYVPEVFAKYRRHNGSISGKPVFMRRAILAALCSVRGDVGDPRLQGLIDIRIQCIRSELAFHSAIEGVGRAPFIDAMMQPGQQAKKRLVSLAGVLLPDLTRRTVNARRKRLRNANHD